MSTKADPPPAAEQPAEEEQPALPAGVLFEGPKASLVSTMKKVSIANLSFAVVSSPIIYAATLASGAPGKGIAMSALLLAFGGGTTAALTWATKTYVKSIRTVEGSDALHIVTPTFFGGDMATQVALNTIGRVDRYHPFSTFAADGKLFYLDEVGQMEMDLQNKLNAALNAGEGEE